MSVSAARQALAITALHRSGFWSFVCFGLLHIVVIINIIVVILVITVILIVILETHGERCGSCDAEVVPNAQLTRRQSDPRTSKRRAGPECGSWS